MTKEEKKKLHLALGHIHEAQAYLYYLARTDFRKKEEAQRMLKTAIAVLDALRKDKPSIPVSGSRELDLE